MSSEGLQDVLNEAYQRSRNETSGSVATYIPELGKVSPDLFAAAVCKTDGSVVSVGDTKHRFTLQSISKVLTYACVLEHYEAENIYERVGVEASGEEFDSIIKLDKYKRPFNPMVNAGAIAITDLLISKFKGRATQETLAFFAHVLGKEEVTINEKVFESERKTGERNRAIAHLLKNFSLLDNPVEEVLDLYFRHCSIEVNVEELAWMGAVLANQGIQPETGKEVLNPTSLRKILSVMLSCGMYNYAGQWTYEVGLPAKSGVSGGVLTVVPERMGIAAFSPKVDEKGSSLRGVLATKRLSEDMNLHIFGYAR